MTLPVKALILRGQEEFLGKTFIQEIPWVRRAFRCFTELPRPFLSLRDWIDYKYGIEGMEKRVQGPPEKVILKDFYGIEPRIFSLFTLFDPTGRLSLEDLLGRRVTFTSGQWERVQSLITVGEEANPWFNLLFSYSRRMMAPRRPALVVEGFEDAFPGRGDTSIIHIRPSLWRIEENRRSLSDAVNASKARFIIAPMHSLGLLHASDPRDASKVLETLHSLLPPSMEAPGMVGEEASSIRGIDSLKERIGILGESFDQLLETLIHLSRHGDRTITTGLVSREGDKLYTSLVAVSGDRILSRRATLNQWLPFFEEGEEPQPWEIGGKDFLIYTGSEVSRVLGRGWEGDRLIHIVFGPRRIGARIPCISIHLHAYPQELPRSSPWAVCSSLSFNGEILALGPSPKGLLSMDLEGLMDILYG